MELDTLDGSTWDVLIAGTGIHESLLALALSRSGQKILHVDKNSYYGGGTAAFSLQDAQEWSTRGDSEAFPSSFTNVKCSEQSTSSVDSSETAQRLGFSRAYSVALAPQIIYTQSALLPALVSSRVDSQLDFLAVGSFFTYVPHQTEEAPDEPSVIQGALHRVPNSREEIFADTTVPIREKRGLVKFIKFVVGLEDGSDIPEADEQLPLDEFLTKHFNISPVTQRPIHTLTLSLKPASRTKTKFALGRIARHLTSIGVFGPGFCSVTPKWGGLSEISQVGCRACAVGGGVYVLGNGIQSFIRNSGNSNDSATGNEDRKWQVQLEKGETVSTDWIVGGNDNVKPAQLESVDRLENTNENIPNIVSHLIAVVSSPLDQLFQPTVDDGPVPAVAVVQFPESTLFSNDSNHEAMPIYIRIHSSDTGECPVGQSILYCTVALEGTKGFKVLSRAAEALIRTAQSDSTAQILWKFEYEQHSRGVTTETDRAANSESERKAIVFPPQSLDLAFDDEILRQVRTAWQKIMGADADDFLMFAPREQLGSDEEEA